jgi:hypothetical protein
MLRHVLRDQRRRPAAADVGERPVDLALEQRDGLASERASWFGLSAKEGI